MGTGSTSGDYLIGHKGVKRILTTFFFTIIIPTVGLIFKGRVLERQKEPIAKSQ
jgi:hypothetical protein